MTYRSENKYERGMCFKLYIVLHDFIPFMVTSPVATKLYHCMNQARKIKNIQLMMIYNKLATIFLELIYVTKWNEHNVHFERGM
jgi:hypothetical protein